MVWFPDSKWLEVIKLSGGMLLALGIGLCAMAFMASFFPNANAEVRETAQMLLAIAGGFFLCLWTGKVGQSRYENWSKDRQERRRREKIKEAALRQLPMLNDRERKILGWLVHNNQQMFNNDADGGLAGSLEAKGFVRRAAVQGQMWALDQTPFAIPEPVWEVLVANKDQFPVPIDDQRHPWRDPLWSVRTRI